MSEPLSDAIVEVRNVLNDLAGYLDRVSEHSVLSAQQAATKSIISDKIRALARELDDHVVIERFRCENHQPEIRSS